MANKNLFQNPVPPKRVPTTVNHAGGRAYDPGAEHGLAQMAMTCTLADSYYTSSEAQLKEVLDLCAKCDPTYVGKLAVYAREVGQMKDLPALLTAYLASVHAHDVLDKVFARVIDNGRMVRNFFQIIRSGRLGRRGLGSQPKRLLRAWFARQGADGVYKASVGSNPSLADVIRMARPVPLNDAEKDMYRYLIGKGDPTGAAWNIKRWSENADNMASEFLYGVPFELLAGGAKTQEHWNDIARVASWNATLKNLNTFARHEISKQAWALIAEKLQQRPPRHVFPYSIMTAFQFISDNAQIPMSVKVLVQKALDAACENVPVAAGTVAVLVDTSGSMKSPVTGHRGTATGKTQCVDVAALIASTVLRKNPEALIIPFDTQVHPTNLNPLDSVATNAQILRKYGGGGTDVGCGLHYLASKGVHPDLTIIVSDNESWYERWDSNPYLRTHGRTTAQNGWDQIAAKNKGAKLVCLDIQANPTIQVQSSKRVLNLGGFSDAIWTVVKEFAEGGLTPESWVGKIKAVEL